MTRLTSEQKSNLQDAISLLGSIRLDCIKLGAVIEEVCRLLPNYPEEGNEIKKPQYGHNSHPLYYSNLDGLKSHISCIGPTISEIRRLLERDSENDKTVDTTNPTG